MRLVLSKIFCYLVLCASINILLAEEHFLLNCGRTDEILLELGPRLNERISPCSTFKIALSIMGFDAGILKDGATPTWDFQEGYDDVLEAWKAPQTPTSWMKHSCVWYSKALITQLGLKRVKKYLESLEYGNQDMSGGLTRAWLSSSLTISPKEQVEFLKKMVRGGLPVSMNAIKMTKEILFLEEFPEGEKLYGKTGLGRDIGDVEIAWFVGWVEKKDLFFPFAYTIRKERVDLGQRIPRVKQLLAQANVIKYLLTT